ncbi:4Fe-4S ferredoxin, iron-sulfur binding domain protein [Magnetococcus marinus MC-1]|uniref:Ferredoxin III n=1 Tax=Magnetococcus marinus (strain ATCC BAA-1437 / JCM 17883 / MC-1) TaxID=156889 RepID=A0L6V9_MAGMM|nr:ferredoxin III, nif-specific [Magnetococcus marinus]ABK43702.1 4Fe-4S ferredoxin, iron-sulfur binding domain protein [Magnetococcus marinus MC-1]
MAVFTGTTRGGSEWTPEFIESINHKNCIGCGRCYKVCPRDVFELVERDEIEDLEEGGEDWEEDGFDDDVVYVMSIADKEDCIGCAACSRVCPKDCHSHATLEIAA